MMMTSELRDRQSSHPVKNPASILWQVFRGVARCCLPRFQGQPQHLKYQNWILKKRYDSVYLTCSKKLTGSHGINKKLKGETKNKMMSVIGLVQSHYCEAVQ